MEDDFDEQNSDLQNEPSKTNFIQSSATMSVIISAFDIQLKKFAFISKDNRLKVYSLPAGTLTQDLATSNHLTQNYTTIAWGSEVNICQFC
jgi:hypothetical protein